MYSFIPILLLTVFGIVSNCNCAESPFEDFSYIQVETVKLQVVDKLNGLVKVNLVNIDQICAFQRLRVVVRKCFKTPADKPENYIGYVEIYYIPYNTDKVEKIYSGWMFSENITLNIFEHPVYDVKLVT